MRDEYCSIVAQSSSLLTQENRQGQDNPRIHAIYNIDERDQVMENLQKLFDTHQSQNNEVDLYQQPGCSRALMNNDAVERSIIRANDTGNVPILLASDARSNILKSTMVSGQILSCFIIGGECRICFPQMRALCLGEIPTHKIDEALKSLAIVNPFASEQQLNVLKEGRIIPAYLPKCELITKTNAERLNAMIKVSGSPLPNELQNVNVRSRLQPIKIVHDCFGGCSALLYPAMVPNPCIECRVCHNMFKPEDFCRHTHKPVTDKNTCFWGFDASNWPYYIRIDDENDTQMGGSNGFATPEDAENQLANFVQNYSDYATRQQPTLS